MDHFQTDHTDRCFKLLEALSDLRGASGSRREMGVVPGPCRSGDVLGVWSDRHRAAVAVAPPGVPLVFEGSVVRDGWRCATWKYSRRDVGLSPVGPPAALETVDPCELAAPLSKLGEGARRWYLRRLSDQITALHTMVADGDQHLTDERDGLVCLHARLTRQPAGHVTVPVERRQRRIRVGRDRRRSVTLR